MVRRQKKNRTHFTIRRTTQHQSKQIAIQITVIIDEVLIRRFAFDI